MNIPVKGVEKYWQVYKVTLLEYSAYRLNFLLWRFRAVVQLLVLYFLWQAAVPQGVTLFGYDQAKILTYILGTSIIRSFALASKSADVAGQIASGDLSNFLIKPLGYLKYWFAKDAAEKSLNLVFTFLEISLIVLILKPPFLLQNNPLILFYFALAVALAVLLYFFLSFLLSLVAFWTPESPWPIRFLFTILIEFLSGGLFPLNILPAPVYNLLAILPFPYILFFPLDVYLGNVSTLAFLQSMTIGLFWLAVFYMAVHWAFKIGVRNYAAWGR